MTRLLIQSCSAQKRHDTGLLPALERYDGPAFRLLRKAKAAGLMTDVYLLIVSAEHGLIDEDRRIADYDRRMTVERAIELAPQVSSDLLRWLQSDWKNAEPRCNDVFINLGAGYVPVLAGVAGQGFPGVGAWCDAHAIRFAFARGSIGDRLHQLKCWLEVPRGEGASA